MFFLRKNQELLDQLDVFFDIIQTTLTKTLATLQYVIENGVDEHFEVMVEEINEAERDADEIRKEIEHKMFLQSLLPETREDLLEIIEEMDNVPDTCERIVFIIADQQTIPIIEIRGDVIELIKVGIECFKYTLEAAHDFLGKMKKISPMLQKVSDYEHIGDTLERKMIKIIFSDKSMSAGEKLLQKELVLEIGNICDKSKHSAQKITMASIKRKI
jgi:uncharacterized protein